MSILDEIDVLPHGSSLSDYMKMDSQEMYPNTHQYALKNKQLS